jgi:hypothetical protein
MEPFLLSDVVMCVSEMSAMPGYRTKGLTAIFVVVGLLVRRKRDFRPHRLRGTPPLWP